MIPNRWYPVLESQRLRGRPVGVTRLGRKLVLWRDREGRAHAAPEACPHRGASLAGGRVVDGELRCPWHGFRFAGDGACTAIPCEGRDARPPRAMALHVLPLREAHGLCWLWHGEARAELPAIPFFDDEVGDDWQATAQTSYVLPYHYSRMVETNLDIHHSPFVHGRVFPTGERVDPFEAHLDGDRIRTRGVLVREGKPGGFAFRADCQLPNLGFVGLGEKLHIVIAATPVDDHHSWMWFRYYQGYTRFRPLGRLICWIAVQLELRIVQRQDWRIFAGLPGGTVDDFPYRFVHADQGIALYRKRRAELLAEAGRVATPVREAV